MTILEVPAKGEWKTYEPHWVETLILDAGGTCRQVFDDGGGNIYRSDDMPWELVEGTRTRQEIRCAGLRYYLGGIRAAEDGLRGNGVSVRTLSLNPFDSAPDIVLGIPAYDNGLLVYERLVPTFEAGPVRTLVTTLDVGENWFADESKHATGDQVRLEVSERSFGARISITSDRETGYAVVLTLSKDSFGYPVFEADWSRRTDAIRGSRRNTVEITKIRGTVHVSSAKAESGMPLCLKFDLVGNEHSIPVVVEGGVRLAD